MNEIILYGSVGDLWEGADYFDSQTVRQMLAERSGPLRVTINSGGGIASEGAAIYNLLKAHNGHVTVVVSGMAASAASLIAMAGDEIVMLEGSLMLIHEAGSAWAPNRGTAQDHLDAAQALDLISNAYADIYAARATKAGSPMTRAQARAIMQADTLMDGKLAVAMGFATRCEDAQAATAALFDYRLYRNAPAHLLALADTLGPLRAPKTHKEPTMSDALNPANEGDLPVEATLDIEASPEVEVDDETPEVAALAVAEVPTADAVALAQAETTAVARERTRAAKIMTAAVTAGVSMTLAQDLIERGVSDADALLAILESRKELEMSNHPGVRASIVRDERDTRRAGMTEALAAQLRRRDPASDVARPYMSMSIAEMAAASIGHTGPLRTVGDKIGVFMAAGHATSDFPGIFENALNKSLLERYQGQAPTYRDIAKQKSFVDFRPAPMVRAGDMPRLQSIGENGEIKFGTFGEKRETAVVLPYGVGLSISRQMMVNDDLGAIDDVIGDYGTMVADFEEQTFYALMASATLASDGVAVWSTAGTRLNQAASGTAITVASLAAGKAAMRKQKTVDGLAMNLTPSILLVGPDKEVEALQMVAGITPATAGTVNPFSGSLKVVVSAQISGNAWYLFAAPERAACFVYGYLDGVSGPRLRTEEPFGHQGMKLTIEHDFGFGATDFRGTYRNTGA